MAKIELNNPLISPKVQIANSAISGWGVFATKAFVEDELIEECPAILLKKPRPPALADYLFRWDDDHGSLLLGCGSLYNHSKDANAYYQLDYENKLILFFALRDLEPGEEIVISYGDKWFEAHGLAEKEHPRRCLRLVDALLVMGSIGIAVLLFILTHVSIKIP
jgi:uncharacterized protein